MNADPLQALSRFIVTPAQVSAMQATRMIWRDIIAQGHAQVWAAPSNGGKTTIARLAAAELSAAGFRVFFFQEDAGAGDLPGLHEHAKKHGYSLLNSTLASANPEDLIEELRNLADSGTDLSHCVLFLDTLKKFLDLMNKRGARHFFSLIRSLTQRGATVVMLGHTNKHATHEGKQVFEGVGDVRNDVDELIYIESTDKDGSGIVHFTMQPDKVRCQAREATFKFDTNTLELVPQDEVVNVRSRRQQALQMDKDAPAIQAISQILADRRMPITSLSAAASKACGIGEKSIRRTIERYVSSDPDDPGALWFETYVRATNARMISCRLVQTAKPAKPRARKAKSDSPNRPETPMDSGFGKVGKVGRVGKLGQKKGATPGRQSGKESSRDHDQ